jgi:hypothetical protein
MADSAHKILPHGEPRELIPGVWEVTGSLPFPLRRNMTIVRLSDGTLLLHSVIAMDEAGMAKLDALGTPSIMIVPHGGHRMDPPFFKARYPALKVVAPAAARAKIEEVIKVDATSEEALPPIGVRLHEVAGFKHGELAYELDTSGGKLLIVSDVLANDDNPPPGVGGWLMAKLGGGIKGRLGVPRMMKMMMLKNKPAARASLAKLAELRDVTAITLAHGRSLTDGCGEALKEAAASL